MCFFFFKMYPTARKKSPSICVYIVHHHFLLDSLINIHNWSLQPMGQYYNLNSYITYVASVNFICLSEFVCARKSLKTFSSSFIFLELFDRVRKTNNLTHHLLDYGEISF